VLGGRDRDHPCGALASVARVAGPVSRNGPRWLVRERDLKPVVGQLPAQVRSPRRCSPGNRAGQAGPGLPGQPAHLRGAGQVSGHGIDLRARHAPADLGHGRRNRALVPWRRWSRPRRGLAVAGRPPGRSRWWPGHQQALPDISPTQPQAVETMTVHASITVVPPRGSAADGLRCQAFRHSRSRTAPVLLTEGTT